MAGVPGPGSGKKLKLFFRRLPPFLHILHHHRQGVGGNQHFQEGEDQGDGQGEDADAEEEFAQGGFMDVQGKHGEGAEEEAQDAEALHVLDEENASLETGDLPMHQAAFPLHRGVELADDLGQGEKAVGVGQEQEGDGGEEQGGGGEIHGGDNREKRPQ